MPLPHIDFAAVIKQHKLRNSLQHAQDWLEWRYCYLGGRAFREEYLERFSDKEDKTEFAKRKSLTPIPAFAKRAVNRVRNTLTQRLPDITRRGGSQAWLDAVNGLGPGIDRRGTSMNSFLAKQVIPDLLVMGVTGILVEAPRIDAVSRAEVPRDFGPHLQMYPREQFWAVPGNNGSLSDWEAVVVEDCINEVDVSGGRSESKTEYRFYWMDPDTRRVVVQFTDSEGKEIGDLVRTDLEAIPFVVADLGESLIADACSYQIVQLNVMSADTTHLIDANFPVMVKQRGNDNAGQHLKGAEAEIRPGVRKALAYGKNDNPPGYISPPTAPMKASIEMRREMKAEIEELVAGTLQDMGEKAGSPEAGLAHIGLCVHEAEMRLWDHWQIFEESRPGRREPVVVSYPSTWQLKPFAERIEEATAALDLTNKLIGRSARKQMHKNIHSMLFLGEVSTSDLDKFKQEVDEASYTTADPDIVIPAKEKGILSTETTALALGADENEAEKAKQDMAERAAATVVAQADAGDGAARGAPDLSRDPESSGLAREGERQRAIDEGRPGVRGEGE